MHARKLTHETLTELHKYGVAFVQAGQRPEVAAFVLSINKVTIYGRLSCYRDGDLAALENRKRGGRKPKLNTKAILLI